MADNSIDLKNYLLVELPKKEDLLVIDVSARKVIYRNDEDFNLIGAFTALALGIKDMVLKNESHELAALVVSEGVEKHIDAIMKVAEEFIIKQEADSDAPRQ